MSLKGQHFDPSHSGRLLAMRKSKTLENILIDMDRFCYSSDILRLHFKRSSLAVTQTGLQIAVRRQGTYMQGGHLLIDRLEACLVVLLVILEDKRRL